MGTINDSVLDGFSSELAKAAVLKTYQAELDGLLQKARGTAQAYDQQKHDELLMRWTEQDDKIADLINRLCAVGTWTDDFAEKVGPVYLGLKALQKELDDWPISMPDAAKCSRLNCALHQAWRDARQREYAEQKKVLPVWAQLVASLEKTLDDNDKLIVEAYKTASAANPVQQKALPADLFTRLVPQHLAIAPAARNVKPLSQYDAALADIESAIDAALAPQPALIAPADYGNRWNEKVSEVKPALDALAEAEGALKKVADGVERRGRQLDEGIKSAPVDAKRALQA